MKKTYCLLILGLFLSKTHAQNITIINNEAITSKEFMWAYKKSHNGSTIASYDELLAYLKQYINFKLKVLEAKDMGLDKVTLYKDEVKTYEDALKAHNKLASNKKNINLLLNEYKDGVLMFNVSEIKIWNKAEEDEKALLEFYYQHINNYNKPLYQIRGLVVNDFQQYLEDEWIKTLNVKYLVKINEQELNKLAKP